MSADLFQLNPIFTTIEIHRALVIGTELKSWWWLNTAGWALLLLVVGFCSFGPGRPNMVALNVSPGRRCPER